MLAHSHTQRLSLESSDWTLASRLTLPGSTVSRYVPTFNAAAFGTVSAFASPENSFRLAASHVLWSHPLASSPLQSLCGDIPERHQAAASGIHCAWLRPQRLRRQVRCTGSSTVARCCQQCRTAIARDAAYIFPPRGRLWLQFTFELIPSLLSLFVSTQRGVCQRLKTTAFGMGAYVARNP